MVVLAVSTLLQGLALGPAAAASGKGTITGRIIDGGSGEPLAGAEVRLYDRGHTKELRTTTTDSKGRYTFAKVSLRGYLVRASAGDGFIPAYYKATVHAGSATVINVARATTYSRSMRLDRAAVLTGRVVDAAGAPVTGGFVRVESPDTFLGDLSQSITGESLASRPTNDTYVDDQGRFRITGLPAAAVVVHYAESGGAAAYQGAAPARTRLGAQTEVTITATAPGQGQLRGTVRSEHPVTVRYAKNKSSDADRLTPAGDGTVAAAAVPAGRYYVWVAGRNLPARKVTVAAGGTADFGTFTDSVQWTTVKGRVVHANGAPCKKCLVEILDAHGFAGPEQRADANGYYRVTGLAAGTYTIKVDATRRPLGPGSLLTTRRALTVPAGATVVTKNVRLVEGYTASGRVLAHGKPVAFAFIYPQPSGPGRMTNASGEFTIRYLKPMRYQVYVLEWALGGYRARTFTLTVKNKNRTGLVLRLERGTPVASATASSTASDEVSR